MAALKIFISLFLVHYASAKGSKPRVECNWETMRVVVPMDGDRRSTYLDQMKDYTPCSPTIEAGLATYSLDLEDPYKCGVTRIINKLTENMVFYHKIVIESLNGDRETLTARCVRAARPGPLSEDGRHVSKRAADLPTNFTEPEILEITADLQMNAPEPQLGMAVRQNGKIVSGEISVNPGTPLSMEVFLDNSSAPVYGLQVSYMQVTDTKTQQETIIFNGCSVDPYLFDNFLTEDGDVLTAKFRAFKFPDTTYVQFKGTVTVCLNKCQGAQCNNGVIGYGRRRRSIDSSSSSNKVFEVALTTFIKVDYLNGDREPEDVLAILKRFQVGNQVKPQAPSVATPERETPATVFEHSNKNEDSSKSQPANELLSPNSSPNNTPKILVCIIISIAYLFLK